MIQNNILEKAIIFAAKKHSGQTRKGNGTPYILHPARVMAILYGVKKSSNLNLLMAICILHDTVEDCGVTTAEIAKKFGHHVAACVDELTTDKKKCEEMGKAEYLLNKMLKMSSYSLCVKLADRLDNINDCKSMSAAFKEKAVKETTYILQGITKRKLSGTHKTLITLIWKALDNIYNEQ